MHDLDLTVVAIATPPGRGGVGCIRLSGPDAHSIGDRLFRPAGSSGSAVEDGRTSFGHFLDEDGKVLDHGYLVRFREARSFTGEPVCELWTHGSPPVQGALVEAATVCGAEPAEPGEFAYRAMMKGRIDLTRAEAIRDLVNATTRYQAELAHAQAEGALSRALAPIRDSLCELIVRVQAAVEFEEEVETHLPAGRMLRTLQEVRVAGRKLLAGFRTGRLVREGASLVITGAPNVGKSSLFNKLLLRDRAIITDTPGTTRDVLEESLDLNGIPVRLTDTAGLRATKEPVESEGVRRAIEARDRADIVIVVLDGSRPFTNLEQDALQLAHKEQDRTLVVMNKIDLPACADRMAGPDSPAGAIPVSALTGTGCDRLKDAIHNILIGPAGDFEDPVVTNVRHAEALEKMDTALERALQAAENGLSEELVQEDLDEAMKQLGSITGQFSTEDLFDRIFSTFCIGK